MFHHSSSEDEEAELFLPKKRAKRRFRQRVFFNDEDLNEREFREKFRISRNVLCHLLEIIGPSLEFSTQRNQALTAEQQLKVFLHFVGTNGFYHDIGGHHGIHRTTVHRVVHRVKDQILALEERDETSVINFPQNLLSVAREFKEIANFPAVVGAIDGSKVIVCPPKDDEDAYVDRKSNHSLTLQIVAGPNFYIYDSVSNCPGKMHDSRVLQLRY